MSRSRRRLQDPSGDRHARVDDSPEGWFLGPEIVGHFDPPEGGYKEDGTERNVLPPRVKRQAAWFRVVAVYQR
jgi:hypothetical protein